MGRVVGPGEPQWTEEDTLIAVEWQRLQDELCGGCGHSLAETLDEGNDFQVKRLTCFACKAKENAEKAASEADNADTSGMKITTVWAGRKELLDN